jgi:hypothetical protein
MYSVCFTKRRRLADNYFRPFRLYKRVRAGGKVQPCARYYCVHKIYNLSTRPPVSSAGLQAGNTSFCIRLLQHLDTLCTEQDIRGEIVLCYSEKSAVPTHEFGIRLRYHRGVPTEFGKATGGLTSLIIRDDLLKEAYSREVCDLFTKGSHRRNLSVILITQSLFHQGKHCRYISMNAKYLVLLKNVRDKNQFLYLATQAYPEHPERLYNAYLVATQRTHGYFILDFAQDKTIS